MQITKWTRPARLAQFGAMLVLAGAAGAQPRDQYILCQEKKLEMIVHVFGQVMRPGEYQVLDGTNVLELISKAGGPTEFASMDDILVRHLDPTTPSASGGASMASPAASADGIDPHGNSGRASTSLQAPHKTIKVNMDSYLKGKSSLAPPALLPGDVIVVPTNGWHKWRNVASVTRDVSVIATIYLVYLRYHK